MGGDFRDSDLAAVGSPRGPSNFLDLALGYYDVLDRGSSVPDAAQVPDADDYEQVSFALQQATPFRGPARPLLPGNNVALARLQATANERLRAARNLRVTANSHLQRIKGQLTDRVSRLKQPIRWTPKRVMLRDKITFALGVAHIMSSAFWLGRSPSTIYQLYTVKAILLFSLRFILYKREKMHYYLMDFCYYANLLMIIQVWALPEWCALEKALFAFSMGPLAWSIIAFRNSMIFHSLDKMTSVFLHAFPPLVAWSQRWYPGDANHWKTIASKSCEAKEANVWELIVIPWIPYALWAVVYYLKIFVISSKRIQDRGYHTLFKYMTRKPKSLFGRWFKALPRWLSPIVFMLWHIVFCAVTFVLSWLMWQHYWLNTAFLVAMLWTSAWQGGSYYFDVFAHRYLEETGIEVKKGKHGEVQAVPVRGHSIDALLHELHHVAGEKATQSAPDITLCGDGSDVSPPGTGGQIMQWQGAPLNGPGADLLGARGASEGNVDAILAANAAAEDLYQASVYSEPSEHIKPD